MWVFHLQISQLWTEWEFAIIMFSQFRIQNNTDWVPVWLHTSVIVIWQNNFRCQFWNRSLVFFLVVFFLSSALVNQMEWNRLPTVPCVHECHQIIIFVRLYNEVHIDSIWCSLDKSINFHHSHWLHWWIHYFCLKNSQWKVGTKAYFNIFLPNGTFFFFFLKDLNSFSKSLNIYDGEFARIKWLSWRILSWFEQNGLVSKMRPKEKHHW